MKNAINNLVLAAYVLLLLTIPLTAQENTPNHTGNGNSSSVLMGKAKSYVSSEPATIGGQWFLSFRTGETGGEHDSEFLLHRGYINIKKKLTDRISGRITPDISVDREGDGEGDLEMRLKYGYLDYKLDDIGFLVKPHIEFGLVHRPWLDFEEHINYYRMQGYMYLEKNHLFNSADFGATFFALLGGEVDKKYQDEISSKYPGKYGSVAFGLYNGGGYHAIERNGNKVFEGRLTIRPLPEVIPGLQFSYHGIFGKGNKVEEPDWNINAAFVSYEAYYVTCTGQFYSGTGNQGGSLLNEFNKSIDHSGYSLFAELKIPEKKISLIGRYEQFDKDGNSEYITKRIITGIAYHFVGNTKALLDFDIATKTDWSDYTRAYTKFTFEFNF